MKKTIKKNNRLYNKACKIKNELLEIHKSLQFEAQDHDTKLSLYSAIDDLNYFISNIK